MSMQCRSQCQPGLLPSTLSKHCSRRLSTLSSANLRQSMRRSSPRVCCSDGPMCCCASMQACSHVMIALLHVHMTHRSSSAVSRVPSGLFSIAAALPPAAGESADLTQ
jgi:hypothetical protein